MSWRTCDATHDPALTSWIASANGHADFPIQNLPLGVFDRGDGCARIGTAIGDSILDLGACAKADLLPQEAAAACLSDSLNALMALPGPGRRALRTRLSKLLSNEAYKGAISSALHETADCRLLLPARIGDYTDFYVGIHHATNVGGLFRPDNPLLPNYKFVPIGYHGRASSVRTSGEPVVRPSGQRKAPDADAPVFGPSARLDYELEMGVWIGPGNVLGKPIPIADAGKHIAGLCLLNDWSARDLQAWEYQPLGPFLAKSFHTTVSPWVVTAEALAPYRIAQPPRPAGDPAPLPYLDDPADRSHGALAIELEVFIATATMCERGETAVRLSRGPASNMYWTVNQIVAHHASNGCNLQPGDLLGTGTISAPTKDGFGSLLELSNGGTEAVALPDGETRSFLADGDEVILRARASAPGRATIGFGECRAVILPAL